MIIREKPVARLVKGCVIDADTQASKLRGVEIPRRWSAADQVDDHGQTSSAKCSSTAARGEEFDQHVLRRIVVVALFGLARHIAAHAEEATASHIFWRESLLDRCSDAGLDHIEADQDNCVVLLRRADRPARRDAAAGQLPLAGFAAAPMLALRLPEPDLLIDQHRIGRDLGTAPSD